MEKLIKDRSIPIISSGIRGAFSLIVVSLILVSCSGLPFKEAGSGGVYHRVKSGETLSAIARAYHTDLQDLAEFNNITDPSRIEKDSVIFIPNAPAVIDEIEIISGAERKEAKVVAKDSAIEKAGVPAKKAADRGNSGKKVVVEKKKWEQAPADVLREETIYPSPKSVKEPGSANSSQKAAGNDPERKSGKVEVKNEKQEQIRFDKGIFIWPVRGKVISFFGVQPGGMFFNGIRIAAPGDAAVFATADGVVIHSDFLKYYGETIIIQHADDYASVYANLGVRAVGVKSKVKKGDRIGFIGKAPENGESYLHFEIRHKKKARNPLFFLP